MKRIVFTKPTAQKIYDDYFKRVSKCISILSADDQLEMLMELNSHVYEATHTAQPENEIDVLVEALEKLGAPEEVLQPAVADKKAKQATRTFNPKHVMQALYLNIFNGTGYLIMALFYLLIFSFGSLIFLKLIYPSHTGLFAGAGHFFAGYTTKVPAGAYELLGNWFIITVVILMILFYFLNTLLFRLLKKK